MTLAGGPGAAPKLISGKSRALLFRWAISPLCHSQAGLSDALTWSESQQSMRVSVSVKEGLRPDGSPQVVRAHNFNRSHQSSKSSLSHSHASIRRVVAGSVSSMISRSSSTDSACSACSNHTTQASVQQQAIRSPKCYKVRSRRTLPLNLDLGLTKVAATILRVQLHRIPFSDCRSRRHLPPRSLAAHHLSTSCHTLAGHL